jgi:hypothetical protein
MLITRTHPIITMTNNGMMRFVKSVSFGIASFHISFYLVGSCYGDLQGQISAMTVLR